VSSKAAAHGGRSRSPDVTSGAATPETAAVYGAGCRAANVVVDFGPSEPTYPGPSRVFGFGPSTRQRKKSPGSNAVWLAGRERRTPVVSAPPLLHPVVPVDHGPDRPDIVDAGSQPLHDRLNISLYDRVEESPRSEITLRAMQANGWWFDGSDRDASSPTAKNRSEPPPAAAPPKALPGTTTEPRDSSTDAGDGSLLRPRDPGRRTVFVTNLPAGEDFNTLRSAFSSAGVVELCVFSVAREAQITFGSIESALKAVECYNNADLNGQRIEVKMNDGSRMVTTSGMRTIQTKTLLVTNLPSDLHWSNLKSAFSVVGRVDICRVRGGMAEVRFRSGAAAEKAMTTYHGCDLNGRRITVRLFIASKGQVIEPEDVPAEERRADEDDSRVATQRFGTEYI
jgi:hypothetical protein